MNNNVTSDLKGKQKGEYQVDIKTGMMLNATVNVTAEGTLQVMGRDVPLTISSEVKVERSGSRDRNITDDLVDREEQRLILEGGNECG